MKNVRLKKKFIILNNVNNYSLKKKPKKELIRNNRCASDTRRLPELQDRRNSNAKVKARTLPTPRGLSNKDGIMVKKFISGQLMQTLRVR